MAEEDILVIKNFDDLPSYKAYWEEKNQGDDFYPGDDWASMICQDVSGKRVMDVGCGQGSFTKYLTDAGNTPAGVDFSLTAVQKTRDKVGNSGFPFIPMVLEGLNGVSGMMFEQVYCVDVLGGCFEIKKALEAMIHICSGELIITVGRFTQTILDKQEQVTWNETFMSLEGWTKLFEESNLEIESTEDYETATSDRTIFRLK